MADDDNLNIFEEFYESIKPGGSFDKGAVNVGKAVTDVFTPNQQTQDEMAQYEQSQQDALNTLYAATGICLLYTSPSPRDGLLSRMPSSA